MKIYLYENKNWIWLAGPAIMASACQQKSSSGTDEPKRTVFFDRANMDTTIKPGDDFFAYANGGWLKKTEIPASQSSWGSFNSLYDDNLKHLHSILDDVSSKDNASGSKEQKVGDLFKSGMDTVAIEKLGYEPLKPQLAKISAVKDYKDLVKLAADGFKTGDGFLLGFYVSPDDRIANINIAHFDQTGLGLPTNEYYFKQDADSKKIRDEYVKYIAKLFTLTGADAATAAKKADGVLKLETEIAKSHLSPVELRDPQANYNKFAVATLQKQVPDIDLADVFKRMDLKADTVLVGQPKYYKALDGLLKTTPIETWKDKTAFEAISNAAPSLSKALEMPVSSFTKNPIRPQAAKGTLEKMVETVDGELGELLGQLYVEKYFTPEAKKKMLDLVNNLQSVYRERIQKLDWMSPKPKACARKIKCLYQKIGYPDKWKNYDDVTIRKDAYYANLQSVAKHNYDEMIKKASKAVDRSEWGMTPPTVNAYYNPPFNEVVFPAGILQFPFFDVNADDAINYGAIGMGIGHEMTHGFDDQGRQYDKDGNLKDWWTPADAAKFSAKVKVMIDQYNKFVVLKDLHVNGSLTQGENLADIGGMAIAYQAFKIPHKAKATKKIDGLHPISVSFSLRTGLAKQNEDEALRMQVNTNPHSPALYRVNGALSNIPSFKAFNIKPGDKLYRPENEQVKVW